MPKLLTKPYDILKREIVAGDTIAMPIVWGARGSGTSAKLKIRKVVKVEGPKVWIEGCPINPIKQPSIWVIVKYADEEEQE
jgi:hypothetical protein